MRKIKFILFLFCISFVLLACEDKHYNEWVEKDGKKMYYTDEGNRIKNAYGTIDGNTYVFDEQGYVITSEIVNLDGVLKIVDKDGQIITGSDWYKINDNWYYLKSGVVQTGWINDKDNWYFLDSDGEMCKNQWIDNTYYVNNDGKMLRNTEIEFNEKRYRFDNAGKSTAIEPYELVIGCQLPKTFRCGGTYFWYDVKIDSVDYEVLDNYSGGGKHFKVYFTGEAGSTYEGSNHSVKRRVGWKLYDPDGYAIDSGTFSTDSALRQGERFRRNCDNFINYCSLKSKGAYRLELINAEY